MNFLENILAQNEYTDSDLAFLLGLSDAQECEMLRKSAFDCATKFVGESVYLRGLIEFSNVCVRDCYYCGIRRGNQSLLRYTLTHDDIVSTAIRCAEAGYGSCVLQAGERNDEQFISFIEKCVSAIRRKTMSDQLPDGVGITLSIGEQAFETYQRLKNAGAHRFLLRIETSNLVLFHKIHPAEQSFEQRLVALTHLQELGFQVGTGVMIGIPGQIIDDLVADIRFFQRFDIDMIGMGPYIVSPDGVMGSLGMMEEAALFQRALNMIAVTRLVLKDVNIAAATALQALVPDGREKGILYGANVIMPNKTPVILRRQYQLYAGKPFLEEKGNEGELQTFRDICATHRTIARNQWGDPKHFFTRQS